MLRRLGAVACLNFSAAVLVFLLASCADQAASPTLPSPKPAETRPAEGAGSGEPRPFTFVHVSDPHLGFLKRADRRFGTLVDQVNRLRPDLVVLTGDLTYGLSEKHQAAIDVALARFQVPVKLIPGNHDVGNHESLATYRREYGSDYYAFTHAGCEFLFLNSMTLDAETPYFRPKDARFREESSAQWAWLEKSLAAARSAGRKHIFLLLHIPPFAGREEDRGKLAGMSPDSRGRLLKLAAEYRVEVILAGHIHKTIERQAGPSAIYTVGGTYWPIDLRGHGYRVFRVGPDGIRQQYVSLKDPLPSLDPN